MRQIATNLVVVLLFLILQEQFQCLLPDERLDVPAATVAFFWLLIRAFTSFCGFVWFTDHFGFAEAPNNCHALLGIGDMPYLVCKIWVRLVSQIQIKTSANILRVLSKLAQMFRKYHATMSIQKLKPFGMYCACAISDFRMTPSRLSACHHHAVKPTIPLHKKEKRGKATHDISL